LTFDWPVALAGLLIIPLAVGAYLLVQKRRSRYAVRFTNLDLLANVVERTPGWRRHLPAALYLTALAALVFALARPQMIVSVPNEEGTILLVTDVSGSMNARDVLPTRLAAAQEAAEALIDQLPQDFRVGLVTFSSGAQTLVAPTTDHESVRLAIRALYPRGSTAMGDAIVHSLDLLRQQPVDESSNGRWQGGGAPTAVPSAQDRDAFPPAVIVLLSDGFNTAGVAEPLEAARDARAFDIPIFTVALGTQDGVAEVLDTTGRMRIVRVPPDEDTLRDIAQITNARFFSAPSAQELKSVYEDLGSRIGHTDEQREVTHLFAAAAALFVVLAGGLSLAWFNRFP
jgi:Ca-activated chloride channel homolog